MKEEVYFEIWLRSNSTSRTPDQKTDNVSLSGLTQSYRSHLGSQGHCLSKSVNSDQSSRVVEMADGQLKVVLKVESVTLTRKLHCCMYSKRR